jgi:hypothetical protein
MKMLKMNVEQTTRVRNLSVLPSLLVETLPLEFDYFVKTHYDLELYRVGKYGMTTIELFYQDILLMTTIVENGEIVGVGFSNSNKPFMFSKTTNFGYNALLESIETYNMLVRGLKIYTTEKGEN